LSFTVLQRFSLPWRINNGQIVDTGTIHGIHAEEMQLVKLTDPQALLFLQQFDYWLNVEGATEEKSQQYAWEDVRREWPELPDKPDSDALEALER
jgi:hypothetical protein